MKPAELKMELLISLSLPSFSSSMFFFFSFSFIVPSFSSSGTILVYTHSHPFWTSSPLVVYVLWVLCCSSNKNRDKKIHKTELSEVGKAGTQINLWKGCWFFQTKALKWREKKEDEKRWNKFQQICPWWSSDVIFHSITNWGNLFKVFFQYWDATEAKFVVFVHMHLVMCIPTPVCAPSLLMRSNPQRFWVNGVLYVCLLLCVCVYRRDTIWQKSSLFSFSSCALLTAIVSPSSFTALPSERGHGEVLSALFEDVITIIMIVLMIIIELVKMKGGVSERVSNTWGELMSALWFQGLEMRRAEDGCRALILLFLLLLFSLVCFNCVCVWMSATRFLVASCLWPKCQAKMERSDLSACGMEASQHNVLINSRQSQGSYT